MSVTVIDDRVVERLRRVHVTDPAMWGVEAGTDFWLYNSGTQLTAGRTLITDGGWTATSLSLTAGTGADFNSFDDLGTPGHWTTNAGADLLQSPAIFGDYAHAYQAAVIFGAKTLPRYLIMDSIAAFDTFSANELTTNLGFVAAGGSIVTSANTNGTVHVGAANYCLNVAATSVVGTTAADAGYHLFRIVLEKSRATAGTAGTAYLYVDNVFQNSQAFTQDAFPVSFGMGDGTTNRLQLVSAHVYYAWGLPSQVLPK